MAGARISSEEIERLRKRKEALNNRLAQALIRAQKRKAVEDGRLASVIGSALILNAAKHPDFEMMLKSIISQSTDSFSDSERRLLRSRGWL